MSAVVYPPTTEAELLQRAQSLAGLSLAEVAAKCQYQVPSRLHHTKGWVGQLLESALGADAGCLAEPDFRGLGIELKSLPVDSRGKPCESTYICTVALLELHQQTWHTSTVWRKLARVLWIPVEATASIPIAERRIGAPLLWSADPQCEALLRQDWEELTELICLGQLANIDARLGRYLQIRPKAAHGRSLSYAIGEAGTTVQTLPRGFYLRAKFTAALLKQHYAMR